MIAWLNQAQSQSGASRQQSLTNSRQAFLDAEVAMRDVIAFVPTEYDNYVFLSNLYNQAGVYYDATYFDKAIEIAEDGRGERRAVRSGRSASRRASRTSTRETTRTRSPSLITASKQDPGYIEPKMLLGDIYRREKDWANAKLWYEQSLKLATGAQLQQIQTSLQSVEASAKASAQSSPKKK